MHLTLCVLSWPLNYVTPLVPVGHVTEESSESGDLCPPMEQ